MTDLEILMAVRGLISKPERWTQYALARAKDDRKVSITHCHACKFSLEGAFYRVQYFTKAWCGPVHAYLRQVIDPHLMTSMESFNNSRGITHYIILRHIDRAITLMGGTPPVDEEEE